MLGVCAPGGTFEVVRGQDNRVPEPAVTDFAVITPIRQSRLSYNIDDYSDNIIVGSISGTTLTVTSVVSGALAPGCTLYDEAWPMNVAALTWIVLQLTGTPGGVGTYQVNQSQTVASETLYAGQRLDLEPIEWTVQCDIHGPMSGDNTRVVDTLFRSEYGVLAVGGVSPGDLVEDTSSLVLTPLYSSDPVQTPFENAEQQIEYRWSMDLTLQMNVVVSTTQQFADKLKVHTVEAAVIYTGP